jgi:hypothetical protein
VGGRGGVVVAVRGLGRVAVQRRRLARWVGCQEVGCAGLYNIQGIRKRIYTMHKVLMRWCRAHRAPCALAFVYSRA